jgi:hypothetical protein
MLVWALRITLILLWLALAFKYWVIAGVLAPVLLALTLWRKRDVRGILTQTTLGEPVTIANGCHTNSFIPGCIPGCDGF